MLEVAQPPARAAPSADQDSRPFGFAGRAAPVPLPLATRQPLRGNVRSRTGAPPSAGVERDQRASGSKRDLGVGEADEGDPLVVRIAVEVQRLMHQHPVDVE